MDKNETLEAFYKRKMNWVPDNLKQELGHFNVFRLEPYVGEHAQPVPYKRRAFYKITLVYGRGILHYADKTFTINERALTFSDPFIPYKWEHTKEITGGAFCIFNPLFFKQFGDINQYPVFQPEGNHVFELTDADAEKVEVIFARMKEEIASDYLFKYDVLRNLVFELLHLATKMEPFTSYKQQPINAFQRISALFLELLERQFPIDESHQRIQLRSASDFARQLNVHVNHLNRAVKATTHKTTSQWIAARLLQEAKILLKASTWTVAEIAYALGFEEATHFNQFFKKHQQTTPLKYRNS